MQQASKPTPKSNAATKSLANTLDHVCSYLKIDFAKKKPKGAKPSDIIIASIQSEKRKSFLIGFITSCVGCALVIGALL